MRILRFSLAAVLATVAPFGIPAFADLTHGERARVPAPIFDAYVAAVHAGRFYVCSDEKRKIAAEMGHDLGRIQRRYMPEFDSDVPFQPLPTHCPAPHELSDYATRISAYRRAVRHLTHVLDVAGVRR